MLKEQLAPYRPSNGTEGAVFQSNYCDRCVHDAAFRAGTGNSCEIVANAVAFDIHHERYPRHTWVWLDGQPTCLAFREMGGVDDEPSPGMQPGPDQLDLFHSLPVLHPA